MKIVFIGTPDYVVPILQLLHKKFRENNNSESGVVAVLTQTPKPSGRDKKISYSAVDSWAHTHKIPIYFSPLDLIKENVKADVGVLASYGGLLPKDLITYFPKGILVIHPSLLPQFRWSSPVPAAIITNTNPTGVSIIKMDDKFDHGPVVTQFKEDVTKDDTYGSLRDRLFEKSAEVLVQMLPAYLSGKINPKAQDDSNASFANMIKKDDAFIPPKILSAALLGKISKTKWPIPFIKVKGAVYNLQPTTYNLSQFIRAMQPWPIAWTTVKIKGEEKKLKILSSTQVPLEPKSDDLQPGTYNLQLNLVQLEGKNPVTWEQFKQGYPKLKLV